MSLEILVDQATRWQLPICTTESPKDSKRGAFEIARDVRMLKDLQGVDLVQAIPVPGHREECTVGSISSMSLRASPSESPETSNLRYL